MYQWHIFVAQLSPVCGSERSGQRPVLVISREQINQILPVVNIIPLTSRKSQERIIYPNEVFIPKESANLFADSIALCYQVRTVDKRRLKKEIGCIHDESLIQQIHEAIRFQLEL